MSRLQQVQQTNCEIICSRMWFLADSHAWTRCTRDAQGMHTNSTHFCRGPWDVHFQSWENQFGLDGWLAALLAPVLPITLRHEQKEIRPG